MTVYNILLVGYEADIVRVFTSKDARDAAMNDYPNGQLATEEAELETEPVGITQYLDLRTGKFFTSKSTTNLRK